MLLLETAQWHQARVFSPRAAGLSDHECASLLLPQVRDGGSSSLVLGEGSGRETSDTLFLLRVEWELARPDGTVCVC